MFHKIKLDYRMCSLTAKRENASLLLDKLKLTFLKQVLPWCCHAGMCQMKRSAFSDALLTRVCNTTGGLGLFVSVLSLQPLIMIVEASTSQAPTALSFSPLPRVNVPPPPALFSRGRGLVMRFHGQPTNVYSITIHSLELMQQLQVWGGEHFMHSCIKTEHTHVYRRAARYSCMQTTHPALLRASFWACDISLERAGETWNKRKRSQFHWQTAETSPLPLTPPANNKIVRKAG